METTPPNILSVLDNLLHTFREYRQKGVVGFECSEEARERLALWHRPLVRAPETLEAIREDIGDCRRCALCEQRHHIVFGAGNPNARLVFVGEGPGRDEDLQGEPFVGAAGELLTKIIQAIKFTREAILEKGIGRMLKKAVTGEGKTIGSNLILLPVAQSESFR